MGKLLVLSLFALLTAPVIAQYNLSGSRRSSQYTYIYRLTHAKTAALFQSNMEKLHATHLHTLVDSFLTDSKPAFDKPGNYLFVQAIGNRLQGVLQTIGDVQFKLLNNYQDLVVALHTKQGRLIHDAKVSINKKNIPFDELTKTYRLQKQRKDGLIQVVKENVLYLFPLHDQDKRGKKGFLPGLWRRLRQKPGKSYRYDDYFEERTSYEKKFTGFMVFSKPKYKPGDTVKLKAWVAEQSGKPVKRPLLLRLTEPGFILDSILTELHPYRPGAYTWQFVINDNLDLSLDEDYLITLEELSSRRYNIDEYDGDLDDDEYAMQRKVLMRGKFHHEEYELTSTKFTARSDQQEHHRGNPVAVYCKASMPVYFTAYQQTWNARPQKVAGDFAVQSGFEYRGKPVSILKAGEPVIMKVTVTVQADADYVMVEVPIPAGCSYKDKTQSWRGWEVHREYNKNKVSIFCNKLVKGRYVFEVSLLPRYTGRYHCNPAKAEMMYFPVFFGREEMKKVVID